MTRPDDGLDADKNSGMSNAAQERQSTVVKSLKKKETFQLIEPEATEVFLVGDFTDWEADPIILKRQKDGLWKATVELEPGHHEYRFLVDGEWRDDSRCSSRKSNPFGGEICVRDVAP